MYVYFKKEKKIMRKESYSKESLLLFLKKFFKKFLLKKIC